uniref:Uncharacterized protein n=1 Tax=Rousettus aegyptiacus TaxID=9407 RepID=A0A7J8JG88_ROUAE|nr:hypothetical protein HJG63_010099 [Rousettus aegyptiacus]
MGQMGKRMGKSQHIQTIEYYSAVGMNELRLRTATFEFHRMLNKTSQTQEFMLYGSACSKVRCRQAMALEDRIALRGSRWEEQEGACWLCWKCSLSDVHTGIYLYKSLSSCKRKICAPYSICISIT